LTLVFFLSFYFHRFFTNPESATAAGFVPGVACLFLASHVEETPKKLRDVIVRCFHNVNNRDLSAEEYEELKKSVLKSEQAILNKIGFDLTVEHPHGPVLKNVKLISSHHSEQENRDLAQIAWNIVNDSLKSTLCLQFRPNLIASAALYLASRFLDIPLVPENSGINWCNLFNVNFKDMEIIAGLLVNLYPNGMRDIKREAPTGGHDLTKRKRDDSLGAIGDTNPTKKRATAKA